MSKKNKNEKSIAQRIEKIIEKNTQAEIHHKTGLSRTTISKFYRSDFNMSEMRLKTIEKLLEIE